MCLGPLLNVQKRGKLKTESLFCCVSLCYHYNLVVNHKTCPPTQSFTVLYFLTPSLSSQGKDPLYLLWHKSHVRSLTHPKGVLM